MVTEMQKDSQEKCKINLTYQQYLQENKSKLSHLSTKDCELIKDSFMRSFGKLLREIAKWQRIGDLRPIGWVSLMFIRSSIKSKEYEFRWDLYDEYRDLFRHAPIFYWSAEELFLVFEKEVAAFIKFSTNAEESLNEEAITLIKEVMIGDYFDVIEQICREGMVELLQYDAWSEVEKSDNIKVSVEHFLEGEGLLYSYENEYK